MHAEVGREKLWWTTWEKGSLMNGTGAITVTLTKRQEVRLSSGEQEVY